MWQKYCTSSMPQGRSIRHRSSAALQDEEQQREVAALFHARLHPVETRAGERESFKRNDPAGLRKTVWMYVPEHWSRQTWQACRRLIEDKKQLAQLQKMHISLD